MSDAPAKPGRRLAAIFHTDVAGYSRLMGEDESGTHLRLKAYLRVMGDCIQRHGGRVVGAAGDAELADFPSVVEAINAAVEIQKTLSKRNAELIPEKRLQFRIGINLGDVIVDGDDIFGDGVNVAARIQSLSSPGGIAISGSVYDQVRNQEGLAFRDRGTFQVKNIQHPVQVYSVESGENTQTPKQNSPWLNRAVSFSIAAIVLAAGLAVAWQFGALRLTVSQQPSQSGTPEAPVVAASAKPTIAILPFEDRSEDKTRAYFSDGLTEDVIIDLGRFSGLLVLSWSAVAPYKDKPITPEKLKKELNARYIVGGSVQRTSDRLRVTVQLTDAERGLLLWSQRFDERPENIFDIQDKITRQVVAALALNVTRFEEQRAFEKPTADLGAYDLVLRGRELVRRVERDANLDARAMFQRAIEIDPRYADAHVALGWTYLNDYKYGWSEWPHRALAKASELAEHALSLEEQNSSAHAMLADVMRFRQEFQRGEKEIARAIELNPNNAISHAIHGSLMVWLGNEKAAVDSLELALRIDPHPNAWWLVNLSHAYYLLGRYEDAANVLERFETSYQEDAAILFGLATAYGQLGNQKAAKQAIDALHRVSPFFAPEVYTSQFSNPDHSERIMEGWRKAIAD